MKNIIIKYGLIAGAIISCVLMVGVFYMKKEGVNQDLGGIIGYGGMFIAFLLMIPAVRKANEIKRLSFGKAFLLGLKIFLIAGALYGLVWSIYIYLIDPVGAKEMGE